MLHKHALTFPLVSPVDVDATASSSMVPPWHQVVIRAVADLAALLCDRRCVLSGPEKVGKPS